MTRTSNSKHALLATLLLVVCLAGFELTNADLWLQGLLFVPASVSGLKATTNVACPSVLADFGGEITYTGLIRQYPSEARPARRQQCFPGAHASGGFALLALYFLFDSPRNRRRAICLGLAAGWYMGAYKMLIGDHFASHTIVSMLWAWLVINVIVMADHRLMQRVVSDPAESPAA